MGDASVRPTGTVAFLFTDIENSSHNWATQPDAMSVALAAHDDLTRSVIDDNNGYVFATGGDGFAAAFARADEAVAAAVALQEGLAGSELTRVRVGVHVGAAEERDGDYFGPSVNLAARVMAAGHGGQILATTAVADSVRVEWCSLGDRVLSGFEAPVDVHQLGSETFPPLRAPEAASTNLRPALTPLLGREPDLDRVASLLDQSRVVTVAGVGGVGKTRLAVEAASRLSSNFGDGGWIVELAEVENPELLSVAVAAALRIVGRPGLSLTESIVATMSSREQLVVLDNCEHLLDQVAGLVQSVLDAAPSVRIIATSREPLDVDGEHVVRLRSLDTEGGVESAAGELFVSRAEAAGGTITEADEPAVDEIIRLLDGIPLAIELAAARARSISVSDLAERLDQRFKLLRGGRRSTVERHQTLQATVDWSYDLLSSEEAAVFDILSVFAGGASLAAVEVVAGPVIEDPWDLPEVLDGLVRKSMIQAGTAPQSRYSLLETMRQYGLGRLAARGEDFVAATQQRHAQHYLDVLVELDGRSDYPHLDTRAEAVRELPNFRVALDFFMSTEQFESAASMLLASWLTLFTRGSVEREFSERAVRIAMLLDEASPLRGELLGLAVTGFAQVGQADRAIELGPQAIEAAARAGREPTVLTYQGWGQALHFTGDRDAGADIFRQGLERIGDEAPTWRTTVLKMSVGGWRTDPLAGPDDLTNVAVRETEATGSGFALALALVARSGRQPTEELAVADLERAYSQASADEDVILWSSLGLGLAAHRAGDGGRAATLYLAAIREAIEHAHYYVLTIALANLSLLGAEAGVPDGAVASLFGAAREMERRSGGTVDSNWSDDLDTIERKLADLSVDLADVGPVLDDRQLRILVSEVAASIID